MTIRYSNCHFAEVMSKVIMAKHIGANPETFRRCSFCGDSCELIPTNHRLGLDLELTLRRWKDGDCSLDDVFKRVNDELLRSYEEARGAAAETLQKGKSPKYELRPGFMYWTETNQLSTKERGDGKRT